MLVLQDTRKVPINQEGTRIGKDWGDLHGLQMTNWKIEAKFVTMEYRDVNISLSLKRLNKMTRSHLFTYSRKKIWI